jgi:hypothetical protein
MIINTAAVAPLPGVDKSQPEHLAWAIVIAIALSFVLAAIEISNESKKPLRSCLVFQSFFYCCLLTFGNVVTTLIATVLVTKMDPDLKPYYFIFAAFTGVFAFETILKNTNVTVLDKGVLTIQVWINKALTAAAAAAIERDIQRTNIENGKLAKRLSAIPEIDLNTFVALKLSGGSPSIVKQLDNAATTNNADRRLYKAYAIVTAVSRSEVASFLGGR